MSFALRRATQSDAPLLARHRAAVWNEVGGWEAAALAVQIPIWSAYFTRAVADRTYLAWIAADGDNPLGSGALLIHAAISRPGLASDRAGRVQSIYVAPQARRGGIARAIVERLLEDARNERLIFLSLRPSDEARALYASLGFAAADEMTLTLPID